MDIQNHVGDGFPYGRSQQRLNPSTCLCGARPDIRQLRGNAIDRGTEPWLLVAGRTCQNGDDLMVALAPRQLLTPNAGRLLGG